MYVSSRRKRRRWGAVSHSMENRPSTVSTSNSRPKMIKLPTNNVFGLNPGVISQTAFTIRLAWEPCGTPSTRWSKKKSSSALHHRPADNAQDLFETWSEQFQAHNLLGHIQEDLSPQSNLHALRLMATLLSR
ncbi:putative RNA-directed DNA polymerase from mobile element jockey-like 85 [Homarus americanus]|uniref:Putative RNA-directed DNA polymerase from mobile element jockey-like 85 n=1 Tax=Homarus americanus TaxID=6706 RepID=A0A8J5JKT0_HOMAM|nr:putative RNA-directed DNA polymerase from mobile element jockey-like 85 [Homarus americanus]